MKPTIDSSWIKTEVGIKVYRVRISLQEGRPRFAKRFLVQPITVYNWERGRSQRIQPIHLNILNMIYNKLLSEGRLVPLAVAEAKYQQMMLAEQPNATTAETTVAG